jgi:hypothetical protein
MRPLILLFSMLIFIGISGASTVTLTGVCRSNLINQTNDYITFNLINSGNGTATNLLIEPEIYGASTQNSLLSIPIVAPGATYSNNVYLSNFTIPGSYVERFDTTYSQGASTFVTLFPCLVDIEKSAQSLIQIKNLSRKGSNITVNISSVAANPIDAQISVYAPPSFTVENPIKNTTIGGHSYSLESFGVSTPQYTNAEFPIVVTVSYISNGTHYATLGVTTISFGGTGGSAVSGSGNFLLIGIVAIIIIILILILISVLVNRRKHKKISESP